MRSCGYDRSVKGETVSPLSGEQWLLGVVLNDKRFANRICLKHSALAAFQNCTSAFTKLSFTDLESVLL
jgi:hypothetical protein